MNWLTDAVRKKREGVTRNPALDAPKSILSGFSGSGYSQGGGENGMAVTQRRIAESTNNEEKETNMELSRTQHWRLRKWEVVERLLDRAREHRNSIAEIAAKSKDSELKECAAKFTKELEQIEYELTP